MSPWVLFILLVAFSALWLFAYATFTAILVDTKLGAIAFALLCGIAFVHAVGMGAVVSLLDGPGWLHYWWWFILYFIGTIIAILTL